MKKFLLLLLIVGIAGLVWWRNQRLLHTELLGFAQSNGRLALERYHVASLRAGKVEQVPVQEGQMVAKDALLVSLASEEAEAKFAAAQAALQRAKAAVARAEYAEIRAKSAWERSHGSALQADAEIAAQQAQLAITEEALNNARQLFKQKLIARSEVHQREKARDALRAALQAANAGKTQASAGEAEANAAINEAQAAIQEALAAQHQAEAEIRAIESAIADLSIKAPIAGRVEYTVAQVGNVIAAGSIVASLLDPNEVSMELFLPMSAVSKIAMGAEARIVPDGMESVFPAQVSQIADKAQFTPKYVETRAEREQLLYRVTIKIPTEISARYADRLKDGMTALGYVRLDPAQAWSEALSIRLPPYE